MLGGYMHRFLWINLSNGNIWEERPEESFLREYVGGYGVAAKMLYDCIPSRTDPLGPDNILGFVTGPLTGTPAPTGTRWTVVAKSPLTGGWGDANGSGFFAAKLKQAGFDAVFIVGISEEPVYLMISEGKPVLRSAQQLWGMETYDVEDWVKAELGKDFEVACIGPAGERLVLISGVVTNKGRIAARSGLGAVMGSKRLKMIVVKGKLTVPIADQEATNAMKQKYGKQISSGVGAAEFYKTTGTPGYTHTAALNGDSPTRNWGASVDVFPNPKELSFKQLLKYRIARKSCWRCPIGCWGISQCDYDGQPLEAHQPEYETAAAFGTMTLNNNYPSIIKANDICNRYGLDTISAGSCVAFAIECYENGLIGLDETGGLELSWGDHQAMIAMLEKIARREDFGDVLANGVRQAAEFLGPAAEPFAIHCGGQELPMHDPRYEPAMAVIYKIDATPGRHSQAAQFFVPPGYKSNRPAFGERAHEQDGRGFWVKEASCLAHTMNASGVCLFGYLSTEVSFIPDFISSVTGWDFSVDEMITVGERIANVRQAFNIREGINQVEQSFPARAIGRPPLSKGPTAGIEVQIEKMLQEYLDAMGWTRDAAIPRPEVLERLGLKDIAIDLQNLGI